MLFKGLFQRRPPLNEAVPGRPNGSTTALGTAPGRKSDGLLRAREGRRSPSAGE